MVHFKRTTIIFVAIVNVSKILDQRGREKRLPVEQIHRAVGVYFCGKDDSPEPARSTIRPQSDVGARNRASLPKQVLEILPLAVEGKLLKYVVVSRPL